MNLPEFYADPVSQMQVQAYGSSTREVHMFSTKCKHSEINASAKCWISLPYVNAWCLFACLKNNTRKKWLYLHIIAIRSSVIALNNSWSES